LANIRANAGEYRKYKQHRAHDLEEVTKKIEFFVQARKEHLRLLADDQATMDVARKRLARKSGGVVSANHNDRNVRLDGLHKGMLPWPVQGKLVRNPGIVRDTQSGAMLDSPGIDIATTSGAPVAAPADGQVIELTHLPGYGNTLLLDHGLGYVTVYAGLERIDVQRGDRVASGDPIGLSSRQLHFQVWHEKKRLNPVSWLVKK